VKRKRSIVEQIVAVLKQAEMGIPLAELIRQSGSPRSPSSPVYWQLF
jgi:hypothetical protein